MILKPLLNLGFSALPVSPALLICSGAFSILDRNTCTFDFGPDDSGEFLGELCAGG